MSSADTQIRRKVVRKVDRFKIGDTINEDMDGECAPSAEVTCVKTAMPAKQTVAQPCDPWDSSWLLSPAC